MYTDKDKVHDLLIERNVKHFSLAENTPQGINGFIYEALGPYGTSEFSDRVLEDQMTEEDKAGFNLIEAKELFMATTRPDPQLPPEKWTSETLERLKAKLNKDPEQNQDGGESQQVGNNRDISLCIMP